MSELGEGPEVSVIIPAWFSQETVAGCLESLRRQSFTHFETILVDSSPNLETATLVGNRFPEVRLHHHPRRLLPHAARNLGAQLARGRILVFTDPDCFMQPDWLELLMAAHREGRQAVAGSVGCQGSRWFFRGVHLTKYAWWLPGGEPGYRPDIPTANASYARKLWDVIGPFREDCFCGDTLLSWRLASEGCRPWFEPRAIVIHHHTCTWGEFLSERFRRGHDFGLVRPREQGWSRLRCMAYAAAFPAVAMVMTVRAVRYARTGQQLTSMLAVMPVALAGYLARCAGEALAHWRLAWSR